MDFSLLALPFEFCGLSCQGPCRHLSLWPFGHKLALFWFCCAVTAALRTEPRGRVCLCCDFCESTALLAVFFIGLVTVTREAPAETTLLKALKKGSRASMLLSFVSAYRVYEGQGKVSYSISRDSKSGNGAARAGIAAATAEAMRILIYYVKGWYEVVKSWKYV